MRRLISGIICCFIINLASPVSSPGGWLPWGDNTLLTIDDQKYSDDNFRSWWSSWREPGDVLPDSPDPFIDWMLLFKEAEQMKMYEDLGYQRKINTFLKARTLMMLKGEEIDSKTAVSDDDLWQRYQKYYIPIYQLNVLFFNTREDAERVLEKFGHGPISDEQLVEIATSEVDPIKVEIGWFRLLVVDPGWHEIIRSLQRNHLSDPVVWKDGVVILRLQDQKEGDRDDFATVRDSIFQKLRKKKANERTIELIMNLRDKYHVQIDEERLKMLDIDATDDSFTDEPIVTTDIMSISEKEYMAQVRGMQNFRGKTGFNDDGYRYKEQVLNDIINQTLTTTEGLNRGYEKKSPFKEVFEFYKQHRMIKSLEARVFASQATVTPDDIKAYYDNHLSEYSRPETVKIVSVDGTPADINALWTLVAMGGDFRALAHQRFDRSFQPRIIPADHLAPETAEALRQLTKNEVSSVFTVNGRSSLVQLIERTPAQPLPLAQVSAKIKDMLYKEKLNTVRKEYIDKLRAGSSHTVNNQVWQKLKKELEQEDAKNKQ